MKGKRAVVILIMIKSGKVALEPGVHGFYQPEPNCTFGWDWGIRESDIDDWRFTGDIILT